MNNLPAGAEFRTDAPWNNPDKDTECPVCGGELYLFDHGEDWEDYKCHGCDYRDSNEPCYD